MVRGKSCSSCFARGSDEVLNCHNTIYLMHHDGVCDFCCSIFYPCDCNTFLYYLCLRLDSPRNSKRQDFLRREVSATGNVAAAAAALHNCCCYM